MGSSFFLFCSFFGLEMLRRLKGTSGHKGLLSSYHCSPILSRCFHSADRSGKSSEPGTFLSKFPHEKKFAHFYEQEVKRNQLYRKVDANLLRVISKESFYEGLFQGTTLSSGGYVRKTFSWILFFAVIYFLYFELDTVLEKVAAGESKVSKAQADDPFGYLVSISSKIQRNFGKWAPRHPEEFCSMGRLALEKP